MAVDQRKAYAEGLNGAVAAELRAEKAAQNLTNQDIADSSGIPVVSVQRYLAPTREIDVTVLGRLAVALGKTAAEVVEAAEVRLARQAAKVDVQWPRDEHGEESVTLRERREGTRPQPRHAEPRSGRRR